jgi:hypothetical protein
MEDSRSIKDFAVAPDYLTAAAYGFLREFERICGFVAYVTHLASHIDESARIAHKALALVDKPGPEEYEKGLKDIDDRGAVMELRRRYREIVLEMMLSRGVENFLTYLSEMLGAIFRARPETMRSSATIRVDEVLKHSSMDEFVSYLAEKQVNQLSYHCQSSRCCASQARSSPLPHIPALTKRTRSPWTQFRGVHHRLSSPRARNSP